MTTTVLSIQPPKFRLGELAITPNAQRSIDSADVATGLQRHAQGDWGEMPHEDVRSNIYALKHGGRLMSAYGSGEKRFWINTEADRSVTTVLLPQDY